MLIIEPVITRPLLREWETVRDEIRRTIEPAQQALEEAIASTSVVPELLSTVTSARYAHVSSEPGVCVRRTLFAPPTVVDVVVLRPVDSA